MNKNEILDKMGEILRLNGRTGVNKDEIKKTVVEVLIEVFGHGIFTEPKLPPSLTRKCSCCGQYKPLSEYSPSGINKNTGRTYLRADCKDCNRQNQRRLRWNKSQKSA